MHSLVCVNHSDFDGTLQRIEVEGGVEGAVTIPFYAYHIRTSPTFSKQTLDVILTSS